MKAHWNFLKYLLRHKWYVFWECRKLGVPLYRALLHDCDKFLPDIWFPYVACFGKGIERNNYADTVQLAIATNKHYHRSDHHWQSWIIRWDQGDSEALDMSDVARREMLADWRAVQRTKSSSTTKEWYNKNILNILLHHATRNWIEQNL